MLLHSLPINGTDHPVEYVKRAPGWWCYCLVAGKQYRTRGGRRVDAYRKMAAYWQSLATAADYRQE